VCVCGFHLLESTNPYIPPPFQVVAVLDSIPKAHLNSRPVKNVGRDRQTDRQIERKRDRESICVIV